MSAFYDAIDEIMGEAEDVTDIIASVRKCFLFDFKDDPVRLWEGQGNFIDSDGEEWLGTIAANGTNVLKASPLQDGRDGTSAAYSFSLTIPTIPGQDTLELYNQLKADQSKVFGRKLTCYLALFREGEGLRPDTPLSFYKEMVMYSPVFSEEIARDKDGVIVKSYTVTITARDQNSGRSEVPGRTYADTMQKQRAAQLGVSVDKGAEFLAALANRTYQIP